MKTAFRLLRHALFAGVCAAAFSACNTGTNSGDTNVETGATKNTDPATLATHSSDSATAGLPADTAQTTGRDLYEQAGESKDRNNDGIAD